MPSEPTVQALLPDAIARCPRPLLVLGPSDAARRAAAGAVVRQADPDGGRAFAWIGGAGAPDAMGEGSVLLRLHCGGSPGVLNAWATPNPLTHEAVLAARWLELAIREELAASGTAAPTTEECRAVLALRTPEVLEAPAAAQWRWVASRFPVCARELDTALSAPGGAMLRSVLLATHHAGGAIVPLADRVSVAAAQPGVEGTAALLLVALEMASRALRRPEEVRAIVLDGWWAQLPLAWEQLLCEALHDVVREARVCVILSTPPLNQGAHTGELAGLLVDGTAMLVGPAEAGTTPQLWGDNPSPAVEAGHALWWAAGPRRWLTLDRTRP